MQMGELKARQKGEEGRRKEKKNKKKSVKEVKILGLSDVTN